MDEEDTRAQEGRPLRIRWENETQGRYYETYLAPDIFGGWTLTRVWGRRGSPMGGLRNDHCESYGAAMAGLAALAARRKRNLYRIVSGGLPAAKP